MSLIAVSLIANIALVTVLLMILLRAKARIIEEKLATFAGALNAITFGVAAADPQMRWNRLAFGLKGMLGSVEEEEIQWRLVRASMMRFLRTDPVAADLGERMRALALECMMGEAEAERVWAYIDGALAEEPGFEKEPEDHFTGAELAHGQFQLEAKLFRMYAAELAAHPPRLFQ
jgi:hypothetical protein